MRLKSYFANTMEEAMLAAKNELGDEAMLVDSKRLAAGRGERKQEKECLISCKDLDNMIKVIFCIIN